MKKLLLLGDSISLHYGPYLAAYLKDTFAYYTKDGREEALADINNPVQANCGDSGMLLQYLKEITDGKALDYDMVVLNCGLHDIKRTLPEKALQITPDAYEKNLREIFHIGKSRGIKMVFVTTTPVDDERHNSRSIPNWGTMRCDEDVRSYNQIACRIAETEKVSVIDLYGFTKNIDSEKYIDHVHYCEDLRKLQAAYLAGNILSMVRER